jgi:hypothetical protein
MSFCKTYTCMLSCKVIWDGALCFEVWKNQLCLPTFHVYMYAYCMWVKTAIDEDETITSCWDTCNWTRAHSTGKCVTITRQETAFCFFQNSARCGICMCVRKSRAERKEQIFIRIYIHTYACILWHIRRHAPHWNVHVCVCVCVCVCVSLSVCILAKVCICI